MNTPTIDRSTFAQSGASASDHAKLRCERLGPQARAEVMAHFSSLSPADLALRFSACVTAYSLERYVAALDFTRNIIVAARSGAGVVIGIVQLLPFASDQGQAAEIAFSVAPPARGCGLGSRLMQEAIGYAQQHGVTRLVAQVCADNAPMLAVLRGAGMSVAREDGEIVGTLVIAPRNRRRAEPRAA